MKIISLNNSEQLCCVLHFIMHTSQNSFTVVMKLNFHEFSVLHIPMSFNFYFLFDTFSYMNWFPPTFSYQRLYALHIIKIFFFWRRKTIFFGIRNLFVMFHTDVIFLWICEIGWIVMYLLLINNQHWLKDLIYILK